MNVNVPYIRQRRKSNLGKRHRPSNEASRPAPVYPTSTYKSGLNRLRSAKKTNIIAKASKDYTEAKKRLMFLRTSDSNSEDSHSAQKFGSSSRLFNSSFSSSCGHEDNSLNMTGIKFIKTPSPEQNIYAKKPTKMSLFDELEVPKSPGPSLYDQLMMNELVALKPPVDPEESVLHIVNLSLEDKPKSPSKYDTESNLISNEMSTFNNLNRPNNCSPLHSSNNIGSFYADIDKKRENSVSISDISRSEKKLNTINEDLDTTDSFILAEQTLNQTIIAPELSMMERDVIVNLVNSKITESNTVKNVSNFEKNGSQSDEELENIIKEIDEGLQDMNKIMNRMVDLKSSLQKWTKKRKQKNNKIISVNKENIPNEMISIDNVPEASCKKLQNKWISSLKTDNPRLLKTPKMAKGNKTNISFADQSTIWTPHSISTVLHEQIEDLFD